MKKITLLLIIFSAFSTAVIISCDDSGTALTNTNISIRLSDATGQDAYITNYPAYVNTNFRNDSDFAGIAFDSFGTQYIGRTLFKFNLSEIPSTANVTQALLLLSYNQTPTHYTPAGHRQDSGSNACFIYRIIETWSDSSITWNNQPVVTTVDVITLPASTDPYQSYSVDMTAAINYAVKYPTTNFGYILQLQTESPVRVLGFSSGNSDSLSRPVLQVTYTSTP